VVFISDRLVDKENKVEVVLKRSIRTLFIISNSCKECCFQKWSLSYWRLAIMKELIQTPPNLHNHHHFLEIKLIHVNYCSRQHWWIKVVHYKIVCNDSAIQSLWHGNEWVKLVSLFISCYVNLLCLLVEHSYILTISQMTKLGKFHEGFCNAKLHTIVNMKGLNINVPPFCTTSQGDYNYKDI
jgi:hypothetical protein